MGRTWEQERRAEQQAWYDVVNTTQVKLKLNKKTDADILAWLSRQKYGHGTSMQGSVKALIRAEIAKAKEDKAMASSDKIYAADLVRMAELLQAESGPDGEKQEYARILERMAGSMCGDDAIIVSDDYFDREHGV